MRIIDTLVPYLIGAATALAAQMVIQLYVVPRVETRKRRVDRWERYVLELGEVLTTMLSERAEEAMVEQGAFRLVHQDRSDPGIAAAIGQRRSPIWSRFVTMPQDTVFS